MTNKIIILSVLAVLIASSFAGLSFGYSASPQSTGCGATPKIMSVTSITSLSNEKITIKGTNFCSTVPGWDPFGYGYDSYKFCSTPYRPYIQVSDTSKGWKAGLETCSTVDNDVLKGVNTNTPPVWTNTKIIFYGVATPSGAPKFSKGDHLTIQIWSCSSSSSNCPATTYTTTVK
jgi:hypothetical protein